MISIIIPTYNEKDNVKPLIERIFYALKEGNIKGEVIIVDDDSEDETARYALVLKEKHDVKVIVRKSERGLASAVTRGFEVARGDILCVMDADLSHPPEAIQKLVEPLIKEDCEMTIGSRYIENGGVENWPMKRQVISKCANLLARLVTNVKDPMSGFFALKRSVIEGVKLNPKGYKIGLEIIAKGNYNNITEVPYVFQDRENGKSKLNNRVMRDYVAHLSSILFAKNSSFKRFTKFCIVGAFGALINLIVLYSLVEWMLIGYILSAIIAFIIAVSFNYLLNKIWTFKDGRIKRSTVIESYLKFISISVIGLGLNLVILYYLVEFINMWYVSSQVTAILGATSWNYIGSKTWAFISY